MRLHHTRIVKFCGMPLQESFLVGLGAFAVMFAVRSLFSAQIGADALYHITHAHFIADAHDWSIVHPWIVQHFFSTFPANPYVLAHTLLAVLLMIFESAAVNIWVAMQVGFVVGIFFYVLKAHRISHPLVWTITTMFSSSALLFRLSLARPFVLGIGLFVLGMHFMFTKRWRALFILSTLYLLYYNFAIMLGMFAALYLLVSLITKKSLSLSPLTSVFGGFLVAILLHPHTFGFLSLMYIHAIKIPWLRFTGVPLMSGQEIVSQLPHELMASILLPIIVLGVATMVMCKEKRNTSQMWTLLIWCLGWFVFTFFIPRAIEYWILPAWLLAALLIRDTHLSWPQKYHPYKQIVKYGLICLLILVLFTNMLQGLLLIIHSGTNTEEHDLKEIALFLNNASPVQSNIYYPNWAIFPKLFAHNVHNRYLVGFDPVFQYEYSPEMYWLWHNISVTATYCSHAPPCNNNPTDEELTVLFTNTFEAPYLVLPTQYADAIRERVRTLPSATLIFKTPTHLLYKVHRQVDP